MLCYCSYASHGLHLVLHYELCTAHYAGKILLGWALKTPFKIDKSINQKNPTLYLILCNFWDES